MSVSKSKAGRDGPRRVSRQQLLDLIARLRSDNQRLRVLAECVKGGVPIVTRYVEEYNKLKAENERLTGILREGEAHTV